MGESGTYAVIPVKSFVLAKNRLGTCLNVFERARLARLMFEDVLEAACASERLAGILVVSGDPEAKAIASGSGKAETLDFGDLGHCAAVDAASRHLKESGADGLIVIPSDIPHVTSVTIDNFISYRTSPGMALAPAVCDGGTNLLAQWPCDLLPALFGPNSSLRFAEAARGLGVEPVIVKDSEAERDLDRPADLLAFLALKTRTRAHGYLAGLGVAQRIERLTHDEYSPPSKTVSS